MNQRHKTFLYIGFMLVATNFTFAMYDTHTGRFMQQDPIGYVDGQNLYEYVRSNSILSTDPYGLTLVGPIDLSAKIGTTLISRTFAGLSLTGQVSNRLLNNYVLQDDLDEMQSSLSLNELHFYADAINFQSVKFVTPFEGRWVRISVPYPKPRKNEWRTDLSGTFPGLNFWLNEAHDIRPNGKFMAKKCGETYLIKEINVDYEWYDGIDANSAKELKDKGDWGSNDFAIPEAFWDIVGDKILGASFWATIEWNDSRDEEIDISNYVRQRRGMQ